MADDVLTLMERGFDQTGRIVDGLSASDFGKPTLCEEWDVRTTLNHAVGTLKMFTAALTGSGPAGMGDDELGDDFKAAYRQSATAALEAWRAPGALDGTMTLPFGEMPRPMAARINYMDVFVHGCDLAKATGQEDRIDESLCAVSAAVAKEAGLDGFRIPGVFGPEVAVDKGRPEIDKMLGFFGRKV